MLVDGLVSGPDEDHGHLGVGDDGLADGTDEEAAEGTEGARAEDEQFGAERDLRQDLVGAAGQVLGGDLQAGMASPQAAALSRGMRSLQWARVSTPSIGARSSGPGSGSHTCTIFRGRPRSSASRAAHSTAARLSGEPSRPATTVRSMPCLLVGGSASSVPAGGRRA
ncbi:hypothetical protein GCM10020256_71020 [Streptomyces thermocoprophilus]